MTMQSHGIGARACWFVGAAWDGRNDQTHRFLENGIWENGYEDKYLDLVKSIQPGDHIAIKSSFTRKRDLPFDNRGYAVSVMAIKATGTVIENLGDGRTLKVDWTPVDPPREWYFFTYRGTVWRVLPGNWAADALISFAFAGKPQDLSRFTNHPYWRERFGDATDGRNRFAWTSFYEAVANKLLEYREKRNELVAGIHAIGAQVGSMSILRDQFRDGSSGPLQDICPFTTIGIFNRGLTDENRKVIASKLADFLGVEEPTPELSTAYPSSTTNGPGFSVMRNYGNLMTSMRFGRYLKRRSASSILRTTMPRFVQRSPAPTTTRQEDRAWVGISPWAYIGFGLGAFQHWKSSHNSTL